MVWFLFSDSVQMGQSLFPLSQAWLFHSFLKSVYLQNTEKSTGYRNVQGNVPRYWVIRSNNCHTTEMCQKESWIFFLQSCCATNKMWFNYDPDSANLAHVELSFILEMICQLFLTLYIPVSYSRSKQSCWMEHPLEVLLILNTYKIKGLHFKNEMPHSKK